MREAGGVEPGVMPPMSAWCPRLTTKNRMSRPAASNMPPNAWQTELTAHYAAINWSN
jgi:hypothetical protein